MGVCNTNTPEFNAKVICGTNIPLINDVAELCIVHASAVMIVQQNDNSPSEIANGVRDIAGLVQLDANQKWTIQDSAKFWKHEIAPYICREGVRFPPYSYSMLVLLLVNNNWSLPNEKPLGVTT